MFEHILSVPVGLPGKSTRRQLGTWALTVGERPGGALGGWSKLRWSPKLGGAEMAQREQAEWGDHGMGENLTPTDTSF